MRKFTFFLVMMLVLSYIVPFSAFADYYYDNAYIDGVIILDQPVKEKPKKEKSKSNSKSDSKKDKKSDSKKDKASKKTTSKSKKGMEALLKGAKWQATHKKIKYNPKASIRPVKGGRNGLMDCSSFVQFMYDYYLGVELKERTTWDQMDSGKTVSRKDLQPGDLLFFYNGGHVGIYLGDGKMIHNSQAKGGPQIVNVSDYEKYASKLYKAVRPDVLKNVK